MTIPVTFWCLTLHPTCACRLSRAILENEWLSALSTILYCFNPASAFHAAAYTESLFAALSFAGMWYLHQPQKYWRGIACFTLATAARSNGLLNGWFVAHWGLQRLLVAWPRDKVTKSPLLCLVDSILLLQPYLSVGRHDNPIVCGVLETGTHPANFSGWNQMGHISRSMSSQAKYIIVMPSDAPHIPDPILPADCCRWHHCTHGRSWCMCSSASHRLPVLRLASALQLRVSRRRRAASTVVLAACTLPVWICTVPLLGRGLPEILGASTGESHPKGPFNIQSGYWPATTHCFPNALVR